MASNEPIHGLDRQGKVARQSDEADRVQAQHVRGKLTARERLKELLDPGTFYEADPFVAHRLSDFGLDQQRYPGDGAVTGFGRIADRSVAVFAQDFTVLGGTFSEAQSLKVCRLFDAALANGQPVIALGESGGARIQEGVRALAGYADLFWHQSRASGVIPQISVIMGPCAGGSAFSAALADWVIMVGGASYMFVTGPEVVKTVTGEQVASEQLGGADVHASISGLAHFVAANEHQALQLARCLLSYLPANNVEMPPYSEPTDVPDRRDRSLDSLVPTDPAEPYDVRAVINCVFDAGSFLEVHALWARNCIVGLARLDGHVAGVVAQQPMHLAGAIDVDASDKMARFVRFCDAFNIPLVTFVDSPGFLPGVGQENRGIIRHGAKLVYAYSEATVPKISVVTRKAYGAAYAVMSSKLARADQVLAWPTAEIAVTGAEGAVNILYGKKLARMSEGQAQTERARLMSEYRQDLTGPSAAAAGGFVGDVIVPSDTRPKLIAAMSFFRSKRTYRLPKKHGTMPF